MKAIDTNVLVYAEITNSEFHSIAFEVVRELSLGNVPWAIPWPCVYEFLRIVTHRQVYNPPVPYDIALDDITNIMKSPSVIMLGQTERHWDIAAALIRTSGSKGNLMHDAHIAALCLEHGVDQLITGDRDFLRFKEIQVINPFVCDKV